MELELRVATRELQWGLDALEAALRAAGVSGETALDLRLVAEEVLTNLAKYGHDDAAEHWAQVRLLVVPGEATLEFTDDGRAFDPLAVRQPDLPAALAEREEGGLGLHLALSLVDTASYARRGGRNVLTLAKRLDPPPHGVP